MPSQITPIQLKNYMFIWKRISLLALSSIPIRSSLSACSSNWEKNYNDKCTNEKNGHYVGLTVTRQLEIVAVIKKNERCFFNPEWHKIILARRIQNLASPLLQNNLTPWARKVVLCDPSCFTDGKNFRVLAKKKWGGNQPRKGDICSPAAWEVWKCTF